MEALDRSTANPEGQRQRTDAIRELGKLSPQTGIPYAMTRNVDRIKAFSNIVRAHKFEFHAPFHKKQLDDVLHQNKLINKERGIRVFSK